MSGFAAAVAGRIEPDARTAKSPDVAKTRRFIVLDSYLGTRTNLSLEAVTSCEHLDN
jgi:hypothetical protein